MAIKVKCKRGSGDREAQDISDALLITDYMATLRCKRFLDDPEQGGYYRTTKRSLRVPHSPSGVVMPGRWVTITDGHLGLSDTQVKVKSCTIELTKDSVFATMETEEYDEFTVLSK